MWVQLLTGTVINHIRLLDRVMRQASSMPRDMLHARLSAPSNDQSVAKCASHSDALQSQKELECMLINKLNPG